MNGDGGSAARPGRRSRRLLVVFVVAAAVVLSDQVTKSLAVGKLASGPVHLVGPISLQLAYNTGVAFSIGSGLTLPIVLVVTALVGLLVWLGRGVPSVPAAAAVGCVLGGALGNLGDRLFRGRGGAVVDFVRVGFWPTFNVADVSIVGGCIALGVIFWRRGAGTGSSGAARGSRSAAPGGTASTPEGHHRSLRPGERVGGR